MKNYFLITLPVNKNKKCFIMNTKVAVLSLEACKALHRVRWMYVSLITISEAFMNIKIQLDSVDVTTKQFISFHGKYHISTTLY